MLIICIITGYYLIKEKILKQIFEHMELSMVPWSQGVVASDANKLGGTNLNVVEFF